MSNKIKNINNIRYNFILLFIGFVPRLLYVLLSTNEVGDSKLYDDIANNLINGCGFAITNQEGVCEHLSGGYFPGYPIMLATFYKFKITHKAILLFINLLFCIAAINIGKTIDRVDIKNNSGGIISLILMVSPLNIGWSRFILIEPVLSIFGLFILEQLILLYLKENVIKRILNISIISSLGIYFKPTLITILPSIFLSLLLIYGIRKSIIGMLIIIISIALLISPWFARTYMLNNDISSVINRTSSSAPVGIEEYQDWVGSWFTDENERNQSTWPIWSGKLHKLKLNENEFLSKEMSEKAMNIIQEEYNIKDRDFSTKAISKFKELTKLQYNKYSNLDTLKLYSKRIFNYIGSPYHSWGFNFSVREKFTIKSINGFITEILKLICKIIFKFYIITYKSIIYITVLPYFVYQTYKFLRFRCISFDMYIVIISTIFFISNIILFPLILKTIEHRYLTLVIPWMEVACFLFLIRKLNDFNMNQFKKGFNIKKLS